jgi:uncharacterized RDD family membrane protein YckC
MSAFPPLPEHDPYAAPAARVEEPATGERVLADRLTRLLAVIVDSLLVVVVGGLLGWGLAAEEAGDPSGPVVLGAGVLAGVALLVLNLFHLHRNGQTLGKKWLGIKVVRLDGSRCGLARIVFARWLPVTLLGAIPVIGFAFALVDPLMIFRADRRCLHDLIADSTVVRA